MTTFALQPYSLTGPLSPETWQVWTQGGGLSDAAADYRFGPAVNRQRDYLTNAPEPVRAAAEQGRRARAQLARDLASRYQIKNSGDLGKIWPAYRRLIQVRPGLPGQPGALLMSASDGTLYPVALLGSRILWLSENAALAAVRGEAAPAGSAAADLAAAAGQPAVQTPADLAAAAGGPAVPLSAWAVFAGWLTSTAAGRASALGGTLLTLGALAWGAWRALK